MEKGKRKDDKSDLLEKPSSCQGGNGSGLTSFVEEVQGQADLGRVETGVLLRQPSLALHVEHEVTTADKLNDKEEPVEEKEEED